MGCSSFASVGRRWSSTELRRDTDGTRPPNGGCSPHGGYPMSPLSRCARIRASRTPKMEGFAEAPRLATALLVRDSRHPGAVVPGRAPAGPGRQQQPERRYLLLPSGPLVGSTDASSARCRCWWPDATSSRDRHPSALARGQMDSRGLTFRARLRSSARVRRSSPSGSPVRLARPGCGPTATMLTGAGGRPCCPIWSNNCCLNGGGTLARVAVARRPPFNGERAARRGGPACGPAGSGRP